MGALAALPLMALRGKRQVWVLLIPETVTDEKQQEMAGQLCRSQSGTLARSQRPGGGAASTAGSWGLFVFVFLLGFFWQLRGGMNQKDKRGANPITTRWFFGAVLFAFVFLMWPCTHFSKQ